MQEYLFHYQARLESLSDVYDGDTVKLTVDVGFGIQIKKFKARLARINTPEIRGRERMVGLDVRDALREKLDGKELLVETIKDKTGKYGRYLVELWIVGENDEYENVNDWLLENNFAELYSG